MVHQIPAARLQAVIRQATIRLVLLIGLPLFTLPACEAGSETKPSPCGSGSAVVSIGVDDPLQVAPAAGFSIDEGLQGGYHVDVSLKIQGVVDPDQVDITLGLWQDETLIARHRTDDWLLKIYPMTEHCEYPRARLVLSQRDGTLFELERVTSLLGQTVRLEVSVESSLGSVSDQFEIVLSQVNRR